MVTKGMLREHLLLLASSMTCAGFLVGFNVAGIKALNKTLNFQVPFSEATVYTPKRCFEKAAEKCHADSLSSIVGACSWGKPVAVGTGSRFDILWDTREVELNQKEGIDVYNFLHMVGGGSEEADSGCLGEVDSFDMDDHFMEAGSPEVESGAKPVFEDVLDVEQSTWGTDPTPEDGASGGGWGSAVKTTPTTGGGWGAEKADQGLQIESTGGWGSVVKTTQTSGGGWGQEKADQGLQNESTGGWGSAVKTTQTSGGGWGQEKADQSLQAESAGGWGGAVKTAQTSGGGWGQEKANQGLQAESTGAWGSAVKTTQTSGGGWGEEKSNQGVQTGSAGGWGAKKSVKDVEPLGSWSSKKDDNESGWGSKSGNGTETVSGAWGQKVSKGDEPTWGAKKLQKEIEESGSGAWGQKVVKGDEPAWGAKKLQKETEESGSGSWGQKVVKSDGPGWNSKPSEPTMDQAEIPKDSSTGAGQWGWNRKAEQKADGSGGWKKKEGWGPKRDRPARPIGGPNDGPRSGGVPLTASRQRLDSFTSDEQEILSDVEPIFQSIRRIMSQTGYTDGDPLPADDQTYILENVFTHHPDKAQKAGAGVDYIMVTKHTEFQDSRCFFVVSTDGRKEDFSYRKCIENFVRGKYPDKVDEFIAKYFRKAPPRPPRDEAGTPRSRAGWNRDTNAATDETGTPGSQSAWKRETTSQPADETATPAAGWGKEASTTTGWGKKEASTAEEGGSSATGWNQAGDETATGWGKKEASTAEGSGPSATGWNQAADEDGTKKSTWGS